MFMASLGDSAGVVCSTLGPRPQISSGYLSRFTGVRLRVLGLCSCRFASLKISGKSKGIVIVVVARPAPGNERHLPKTSVGCRVAGLRGFLGSIP